jgi:phosphoglycolate phosphatase-like HAD superfamily hydrolase
LGDAPAIHVLETRRSVVIKHLIWDVDGTLFDTYPAIVQAFLLALQSFGKSDSAHHVEQAAKVGLTHCASHLARLHGVPEDALGDQFGELYSAIPKSEQPPFDGVKAVCESVLTRGGSNSIATHRARESAAELLSTHDMRHMFTEIVGGDDGFPKKPSPQSFLAIIGRRALDRAETAAIGDRDVDIQAGKAAGIRTCLFHRGEGEFAADLVFSHYRELLLYLEER